MEDGFSLTFPRFLRKSKNRANTNLVQHYFQPHKKKLLVVLGLLVTGFSVSYVHCFFHCWYESNMAF